MESSPLRGGDNINNIIDGNNETSACTKINLNPWFQAKLDGMHCIAQVNVKRLKMDCTFTVSSDAQLERTGNCGNLYLHIFNDSADSTSPSSRSGCSIGDTVKILFSHSYPRSLCVSEIRVVESLIGE